MIYAEKKLDPFSCLDTIIIMQRMDGRSVSAYQPLCVRASSGKSSIVPCQISPWSVYMMSPMWTKTTNLIKVWNLESSISPIDWCDHGQIWHARVASRLRLRSEFVSPLGQKNKLDRIFSSIILRWHHSVAETKLIADVQLKTFPCPSVSESFSVQTA